MPDSLDAVIARLDALREDVQEIKNEDLSEIKEQVKKTNGRVTALEMWQSRILGALAVVMFLITAVGVPIAVVALS